ncbi:MAG: NfeD family protein [Cyanobacteria bacterium P01_D01_bin.128]
MTISLSLQSFFLSPQPYSPPPSPIKTAQVATVVSEILPGMRGRVTYQATSWFAVMAGPQPLGVRTGEKVRVIDRRGNTLVVRPQ